MRKILIGALLALFCFQAEAAYQLPVIIANGASLSGAADLTNSLGNIGKKVNAIGILMPAAWTTAGITVQASEDGTTYYNVFTQGGTEYTITTPAASEYIILPVADLIGANYLKLRSGTAGSPVNQGAARTIQILVQ